MKKFFSFFFILSSMSFAQKAWGQACNATFSYTVSCNVVTFNAAASGAGLNYKWKFGNGTPGDSSTLRNPVFTYYVNGPGNYTFTVKLTVDGTNCVGTSTTQPISINVPLLPTVGLATPTLVKPFTRCSAAPNPDYTLTVSNSSTSNNNQYTISWGDGSPIQTINTPPNFTTTTHTYATRGLFSVVETVRGTNGCVDSAQYKFFNGNNPATAAPGTPSGSLLCVPATLTFPFNSSALANAPGTIYECTVNDGSPTAVVVHDPAKFFYTHTFLKGSCEPEFKDLDGKFTLNVVATNACGSLASTTNIQLSTPGKALFDVKPDSVRCVQDVFDIINKSTKGQYFDNGCQDTMAAYWSITPGVAGVDYMVTSGSLGNFAATTPGSYKGFSVKFSTPGKYTIKLTHKAFYESSCLPQTYERMICVLPKPKSIFTMLNRTRCFPDTIQLTNKSNTTLPSNCGPVKYTWRAIFQTSNCGNGGRTTFINNTNANSQNAQIRFDSSGTYLLRLVVENICGKDSSEQTVTIAESPVSTIEAIGDTCDRVRALPRIKKTEGCYATPTYRWTLPGGTVITGPTPPLTVYNTPGTYTITLTTTNSCGTTTATESFTVFKSPTVPTTITLSTPLCKGQTLTFSNPNPGNLQYKWEGPNNFMSTAAQPNAIPNVTNVQGGTYWVTVTDPVSKCTSTRSYPVTVYDAPPVTIPAASTCPGTPVTLTANSSANLTTWQWAPTTNMTPPLGNTQSVTVTINTPTTYTVTVTDNNKCTNTASVMVTINQTPIITASDATVCPGVNTTLAASGSPAGGMGTWTATPPVTGFTLTSGGVFNATTPGSYTVTYTYTTDKGCKETKNVKVCVRSKPVADFTVDKNNGCAPLKVQTTNKSNTTNPSNCTTSNYRWTARFNTSAACDGTAGAWTSPNLNTTSPEFNFTKPGVYDLILVDSNACGKDTKTIQITVAGPPTLDVAAGPDQCKALPNNSIPPTATVKDCYSPVTGYAWQFPGGTPASASTQSPGNITYTTTGNQIITLVATNACGSTTDRDTFRIVDLPMVSLSYNNAPRPPCAGGNLVLSAAATPAGVTFKWAGPSGPLPNTTNSITIPNAQAIHAGTYTVTVTLPTLPGAQVCTSTASVTVTINPVPPVAVTPNTPAYCAGGSVLLMASGATTYQWAPATGLSPTTGDKVTASPSTTTTYTVTGTSTATGCTNTATAVVTVHPKPNVTITTPQPIVVCANTDLQLAATPTTGGTGTWSGPNVSSTGLFKAPPGTYPVTYTFQTNTTPACVDSAKVSVCVVTPPVADFTLDKTFGCNNLTVKATNASNTKMDCEKPEYNWTATFKSDACGNTAGQVSPATSTDENPMFTFSKTGVYEITLTVKNKCGSNTKTQQVTVASAPQVTIGDLTDLCKQASNTVTPVATVSRDCNSPMTFAWSFPTADNPKTSSQLVPGAVTYTTSGTHVITLTATNACGTSTDTEDFAIKPLPTPVAASNSPVCAGNALNFNVTLPPGTYQYQWAGPGNFTSTSATPTRVPAQTIHSGTYTVTVTLSGCTATATVTALVNPLPVATASVSPSPICYGQSATLTAKPDGMTTYVWLPATDLNTASGQTVVSTPVATPFPTASFNRTYTVTVTDDKGCKNTATATFTVQPLPKVEAGNDVTLCNQAIPFQLAGFSPAGGTWTAAPPGTGFTLTPSGTFTPSGATGGVGNFKLYYTFTDANKCVNKDSLTVKVQDPENIIMPANKEFCRGDTPFKFDVVAPTPTGGVWSSSLAATLNPSTGLFTPDKAGTFTLTYTIGASTCERKGTMTVVVHELPAATASVSPNPICYGQSATLTAKPDGMTTYTWLPATDLNTATGQTVVSTPVAMPFPTASFNRTYTVTVTDDKGCKNTATATFTVQPLPKVEAGPDVTLCNQAIPFQLAGFSPAGGTWTAAPPGTGFTLTPGGIFTPSGATGGVGNFKLYYTFTDANKCVNKDSLTVKVQDPENIIMPANKEFCRGDTPFKFDVVAPTPTGGVWSSSLAATLNPSTGLFTPDKAGTFTLTYTIGASTCERKGTMTVVVNELPVATTSVSPNPICYGQSVTLTAKPDGMTTYAWSPATDLNTATGQTVVSTPVVAPFPTASFNRIYTVTVTDGKGCKNTATATFTVQPLPKVEAGNDVTLCNQAIPFQLTGFSPAGGTWTAAPPGTGFTLTPGGTFTPSGTTGGVGNFKLYYTFTDANKCVNKDSLTVKVQDPDNIIMPANKEFCRGEAPFKFDVLPPTPTGGTWSSSPAAALNPGTGLFTPDKAGTFTLTYTIGTSTCERKGTMTVVVHELPAATASVSPNPICYGQSATLTAKPDGMTTYTWLPATDLNTATGQTVVSTPTATPFPTASFNSTYTVTVTDGKGCKNTATATFTVQPLPKVEAGPDVTLCNQAIPFQLTGFSPAGGTWTAAPPGTGFTLTPGGTFTPSGATGGVGNFKLYYTFTDANKCVNKDSLTVKVQNPDNIIMPANKEFCRGEAPFKFEVLPPTPTGGTWSSSLAATLNPGTGLFTPDKAGTFTLTYTIGTSTCERKSTMTVVVHELPTIAVTGPKEICFGDTATLTASGAVKYTWIGNNISPLDQMATKATPISTQTYTVVGTDNNGCNNVATYTLVVNPLPIVKAPRDTSFCNQPFPENLALFPGLVPNMGGTWSGQGQGNLTSSGQFTPNGVGAFTAVYSYKDPKGCVDTDTMKIDIIEPQNVQMPSDRSVCLNSPAFDLVATPPGGRWSGSTLVTPDGKFTPTTVGTNTLTYTVAGGNKTCERKGTVVVTVNPLPAPKIGGDDKICLNDSTTLTITATPANLTTYAWSPATGLSATDKATVKASPPSNTTYTVTVTDVNGCVNTDTFSVKIDPLPVVSAGPAVEVCNQPIGQPLNGSPTTGGTGVWFGLNISDKGIFTPNGLGPFEVCYAFTDNNGCKDTSCTVVTVRDPDVLILPKDTAVCINSDKLSLKATPAGGEWSGTVLVTKDGLFDPNKDGDYTLTYTFGTGTCLRTAMMRIKVNPLPDVALTGKNVFCFGDTTTLTASGAATYEWSPNERLSAATGSVVRAYPTEPTFAYTVRGTDMNGCINSASINLIVNPLPNVMAPDDITVCDQPIVENLAALPKLEPAQGGLWSGTGQGTLAQDGKFTPGGLGSFTAVYTYKDGNGCVDRDTMLISITAPQTIVLPKDTAVCIQSGVLSLNASPASGEWSGTPLVTKDGSFNPDTAGDYTLTYTFGTGTCLRTSTMKIKVNPLPTPAATGDAKICKNDSTTISVAPGDLARYAWSPATGLSATDKAVVKASPPSSTTYTVTATDINGCVNTTTFSLAIDSLPVAITDPVVEVCNQPIGQQLNGAPTANGMGNWFGPNVSPSGLFTPNGLDTVQVCYIFTDNNGCKDTSCTEVRIKAPENLILPRDTAVCINSGILSLKATPTGGEWSGSVFVNKDGDFDPTVGDYTLTYTFGTGTCLRTATMKIKVNPLPTPAATGDAKICKNDSTTISVAPGDLARYAWSPATGLSATDKAIVKASPPSSTAYTVTATDINGCVNTTTFSLTVDSLPIAITDPVVEVCNQPIGQQLDGTPKDNGMGMWFGPNVSPSGLFTPNGLDTVQVCYVFTDNNGCKDTSCTEVRIKAPENLVLPRDTAVCINSGVLHLKASPLGGDWGGSPLVTTDGEFDPRKVEDYTLTYTYGAGTCLRTAAMKVKVNPLPTPAVASKTICFRESATLVATPGNMVSYQWSPNLYLNAINNDTVISTPTQKSATAYTQTYTVAVVDANGCANSTTATITVNPLPDVDAGSPQTYCDNPNPKDIQLPAATPSGGLWSGPGIVNAPQGLFRTDKAGGPGTYTLFYTYTIAATGCKDLDSVRITVVPPIQAEVPPFDTTCYTSGTTTLTGKPTNGLWSGPGIVDPAKGVFDPVEAAKIKSTPPQTTYALVYTYGKDDCETKDTLQMLTVNYIGVVNAGKDFMLCDSTPAFDLVGTPSGGYWEGPGITNSVNGTFYSAEAKPGTHRLVYFYRDPIARCLWSDTLLATVHPLPGAGFKKIEEGCITKPIQFENTTQNAVKYLWTFGDGTSSEEKDPQHAYAQIGTYTITLVAITDKGCRDSVKQTIIVAEPPVAAFTPSTNAGCAVLCVDFGNQSSGYKISYFWDFGNGDTSTLAIPPRVCYQQGRQDTTYYVQLNVTNLCGTRYELDSILVRPQPVMRFGTNVDEGCSPLKIEFANISYGNPDAFLWDFGNGVISRDSIPPAQLFYTDTVDKVYTIRLIGMNECGQDTFVKRITVKPNNLKAFFNTNPTTGCQPLTVNFTNFSAGQNMVYNWVFGDKTPDSVDKSPSHTFQEAGTFTVVLRVSNGCGYDTAFVKVTVYPQPKAVLAHPQKACEDAPIAFQDQSVGTLGRLWQFGDGDISGLKTAIHRYRDSGEYVVKLTVFADTTGCPATDSSRIRIAGRPIAGFTAPADTCMPANVPLKNQSTGGNYYAWDFGNGNSSTQPNPLAPYDAAGTYRICLVALDNEGCQSDTVCRPVVIHPKPQTDFQTLVSDTCGLPLRVQFKNRSIGANGYRWTFGNGQTSLLTDPATVYKDSGLYNVVLIGTNAFQCADTTVHPLRALDFPFADFEMDPDTGCQPLTVAFDNLSTNFNGALWDFGDGKTSKELQPTHIYRDTGTYTVKLVANIYNTCFDAMIRERVIRVEQTPTAAFVFRDAMTMPPDGTVTFTNLSSRDAVSFLWDFGDGGSSREKDPKYRYFSNLPRTVTLTAIGANGCPDTAQVLVTHDTIKGLFVPNAFMPESGQSGVNVFQPAGVGLRYYKIEIFSSWGERLWVSDSLTNDGRPAEGWNGVYNGKIMPQDVYVWKIEAEFDDRTTWPGHKTSKGRYKKMGSVSLIR